MIPLGLMMWVHLFRVQGNSIFMGRCLLPYMIQDINVSYMLMYVSILELLWVGVPFAAPFDLNFQVDA
jgi:hypothetical protein